MISYLDFCEARRLYNAKQDEYHGACIYIATVFCDYFCRYFKVPPGKFKVLPEESEDGKTYNVSEAIRFDDDDIAHLGVILILGDDPTALQENEIFFDISIRVEGQNYVFKVLEDGSEYHIPNGSIQELSAFRSVFEEMGNAIMMSFSFPLDCRV